MTPNVIYWQMKSSRACADFIEILYLFWCTFTFILSLQMMSLIRKNVQLIFWYTSPFALFSSCICQEHRGS